MTDNAMAKSIFLVRQGARDLQAVHGEGTQEGRGGQQACGQD